MARAQTVEALLARAAEKWVIENPEAVERLKVNGGGELGPGFVVGAEIALWRAMARANGTAVVPEAGA
jgi:hypothetical protein